MQSQTRLSLLIILCGAIISVSYTAYARVDFAYVSEQAKNSVSDILNKIIDYKNAVGEVDAFGVGTNCKEIYPGWNGPINDRINLVFLSSKFSSEDQFLTKAKSLLNIYGDSNSFFSFEPAKSNKNRFNFWYVNREFSTDYPALYQYDCDIPSKVKVNVEVIKGYFGALGNPYTPTRLVIISGEPITESIELFHEFGHAFVGLADEYDGQVGMWKNPSILSCESATSESACQSWCKGPPVDLNVLKNENCSKLTTNQCYSAIDSGSPCRDLSDFTGADGVWGKGRSCVNTVALCTSLTDENTCNNVRNDPRDVSLCSWVSAAASSYGVEDHPYFKSKCIPASNNFNIGTQCIADTGCYNGCGFSRGIFRSKKEGLMQSISPGVTLGDYNEKLMCDRIKSDTGSVGGKCDQLFSLFNNTVSKVTSTAIPTVPIATNIEAQTSTQQAVSSTAQTNTSTITQLQSQLQDLQNQLTQLQNQQTTATTTSSNGSALSTSTTSVPTVVFSSLFSNTSYGVEYYILSWGSVDATSCGSNWRPSALPTSGYENMAISGGAPATFTLTCTGVGGSTSKTISVGGTSATSVTPVTLPTVTTQPVMTLTTPLVSTSTPTTYTTSTTTVPSVVATTTAPSVSTTTAPTVNPGFTITFPTAGWNLEMGESYTIGWRYANNTGNLATARLSLYRSGNYKDSIAIDIPNNGSYVWKVPTNLSSGSDYSIRLFNISASNSYADSPLFSIVPKGGIITTTTSVASTTTSSVSTATTPTQTTSSSPATVASTPTPAPSSVVTTPSSSTPATTTPTSSSSSSSPTTTTITVTSPGFVVTAPSSGISVTAGSTYTVRWQYASNAGNLSIARLSLYQGGSYKDFIAVDIPNNGSYTWAVPNLSGSSYSIRLFNLSYPNNYADSGSFSITAASASSGQNNALASVLESMQSLLNDLAVSVGNLNK